MTTPEVASVDLATRAEALARRSHDGQFDKAGLPYIDHSRRVAEKVSSRGAETLAAAWLHDVLEDCGVSAADLRKEGFPEPVVAAIVALTKHEGEDHEDAVRRACANPIALVVKAADVSDNADPARLALLDPAKAKELKGKYSKARVILDTFDAPYH